MMNEDFRNKINSNNVHIYMKVLKENIADELNIGSNPKPSDFMYERWMEMKDEMVKVDVRGRYNT